MWDFVGDKVRILTNYHTWDIKEFKHIFPPKILPKKGKNMKPNTKRKAEGEEDEIEFRLQNNDINLSVNLTSDMFLCHDKEHDFTVLQLPCHDFSMKRIPIRLGVKKFLKIHTFGYVAHIADLNPNGGEICSIIPHGFTMNLLSAPGYSGAAVVSDGTGRAIGYMGGNYDACEKKNSQHQSYGFTFDHVVVATKRNILSPQTSPTGKYSPKSSDTSSDTRNKTRKTG